jgi:DNA-binding transcriptional MerR regulator
MNEKRYSLDELAGITGLEKRTIRSYMQQGLLRGPEAKGRAAYYTRHHLVRLKALRFLRQYEGRSLDEIRPVLLGMSEPGLEDLARRFDEISLQHASLVTGSPSAATALDYIRSLKLAQQPPPSDAPRALPRARAQGERPVVLHASASEPGRRSLKVPADRQPPASLAANLSTPRAAAAAPIDEILTFFELAAGKREVPRRAKGEAWVVIRVTPDLELHVRGVNSADQLARLERLADHLREALLGGLSHE